MSMGREFKCGDWVVIPKTKQINIPVQLTWDYLGLDMAIDEYEANVISEVIGLLVHEWKVLGESRGFFFALKLRCVDSTVTGWNLVGGRYVVWLKSTKVRQPIFRPGDSGSDDRYDCITEYLF